MDVKGLRWLCPSGFADYNTFLSLGLFPFPVCSSPWQISHDSDIFNILESPMKVSCSWLHKMAPQSLHAGTPLPSARPQQCSLTTEEDSITLLLVYPSHLWNQHQPPEMLPSSAAYLDSTTHPLNLICNISPLLLLFSSKEQNSPGLSFLGAGGLVEWGLTLRVPSLWLHFRIGRISLIFSPL